MKGINIVILIALIAFVIGIVSLAWEYFQTLEMESSILNLPVNTQSNFLGTISNFVPKGIGL